VHSLPERQSLHIKPTNTQKLVQKEIDSLMELDDFEKHDSAYSSFNANSSKLQNSVKSSITLVNLPKTLSVVSATKRVIKKYIPVHDPDVLGVNEYQHDIMTYLFQIEVNSF
jgi:replication fork clamp-binding protein CrfC